MNSILDGMKMNSVLDGMNIDDKERNNRLNNLRKEISSTGIELDYNLTKKEWTELTKYLGSLQQQMKLVFKNQSSGNLNQDPQSTHHEIVITQLLSPSVSIAEIQKHTYPVINKRIGNKTNKEERELSKKFEEYKRLVKSSDKSQSSMVEYFSQCLPKAETCKDINISKLTRFFSAIIEIVKKIFNCAKEGAKKAWEILKDPDSYYIELRGKMDNFLRANPNLGLFRYLVFLPDLFRMYVRLLIDIRVPSVAKWSLFAAIVYLISPIDLMPEMILGPIGYIDDVFIMITSITNMLNTNYVPREIINCHWVGSQKELDYIISTCETINNNVDIFRHIWEWFTNQTKREAF
jgi:uncharacterized membrane protein YkvA (DUF1232 family)